MQVAAREDAVAELVLEVAQCFFRVRAMGQQQGLITNWGGGTFGFLRSLAIHGSLTVPQIARMRPTSRQRMQRLANELAEEGLIEFVENPKHQRSKLVALTPLGNRRFNKMSAVLRGIASSIGRNVSADQVNVSLATLKALSSASLALAAKDAT
jgi:DNA-binding MarR family transcriptional regulator